MICRTCNVEMTFIGKLPLRTGGMAGGWHFLIGELADVGEKVVSLETYRCNTCCRVEFFDLDRSLPGS